MSKFYKIKVSEGDSAVDVMVLKEKTDVFLSIIKFYETQKLNVKVLLANAEAAQRTIQSLQEKIKGLETSAASHNTCLSTVRRNYIRKCEEAEKLHETHESQLNLIDSLKKENAELTSKLQLKRSSMCNDQELYKLFGIEYKNLCGKLDEVKVRVDNLKQIRDNVQDKFENAKPGNRRLKLAVKVDSIEHELYNTEAEYKGVLEKHKSTTYWRDYFKRQKPAVQSTMIKLGWLDSKLTREYRVGLLYDIARLHNSREMLLFADRYVAANSSKVKKVESISRPMLPIRHMLSRASLIQDTTAKNMSDIELNPYHTLSTMVEEVTTTIELDLDLGYPSLPKLESLSEGVQPSNECTKPKAKRNKGKRTKGSNSPQEQSSSDEDKHSDSGIGGKNFLYKYFPDSRPAKELTAEEEEKKKEEAEEKRRKAYQEQQEWNERDEAIKEERRKFLSSLMEKQLKNDANQK